MPWTRSGDNAATYPALMQLQGIKGADERTLNEVFGFVWRCSCQSAAHLTDYVVDAGTAYMLGGSRTDELIKLCERAGVFTPRTIKGIRSWVLLQDPEFIHIQLAEEVRWGRQQRNDTRDPKIRVPVLRRDGDNCRWCGILVQWRGKKTNHTATLDHQVPGTAGTPETMVVACLGCNSGRGANTQLWDDNNTRRPAPTTPRYGKTTAEYLTNHGYPTTPNVLSDGTSPALAAGADTAPSVRPATPRRDDAPGAGSRDTLDSLSTSDSDPQVVERGSAGSGRDGSGLGSTRVGSTWPSSPADLHSPPSSSPPPRRRRGSRGRKRKPQGES